jgi:3-isopropylmalate dehydrogenase
MTKTINMAVIAGDGIGPEVIAEGLKVLKVVSAKHGLTFNNTEYDLGAAHWHKTGETLTDETMAKIRKADVILLGAVGDPSVPSGILERGLLLKMRFGFDHYVNLRPGKLWPGTKSPLAGDPKIDFVVVREGTEGPYSGAGGFLFKGTPHKVATEESLNTRHGVERVVRDAFVRAQARPRKKLAVVHKSNVMVHAGELYTRVMHEVGKEFPEVATEYLHADAVAMFMVTNPERFDVIVTDNLFGDILTDIAAAICGGIGLAASGNINPDRTFPSMFEPVHGSAPDIAGKQLADPTATIMSIVLMLEHLGFSDAAKDVEKAVEQDLLTRGTTKRSTAEVGTAIAALVK